MRACRLGIIALLSILGAAGCDVTGPGGRDGPDGLSLEVPGTGWEHGDTIRLRLRNDSRHALGYGLCFGVLERRAGGSWLVVQSMPEPSACAAILSVLPPGEEAIGAQVVHPLIAGGTYRFTTRVEWPLGGGSVGLTSNTFTILRT